MKALVSSASPSSERIVGRAWKCVSLTHAHQPQTALYFEILGLYIKPQSRGLMKHQPIGGDCNVTLLYECLMELKNQTSFKHCATSFNRAPANAFILPHSLMLRVLNVNVESTYISGTDRGGGLGG